MATKEQAPGGATLPFPSQAMGHGAPQGPPAAVAPLWPGPAGLEEGGQSPQARQLEQQKQLQEDLLAGIVRAEALADERAAHRAAVHGSSKDIAEADFDNPVAESDDEESADSSKKGKKKG